MFDLVAEMLRLARGKAGEAKVARHLLGFVEGDITWLPFHDRAFDAVISLGAPLSHLTEAQARSQALAEMARVVKPEGWIFITGLMRLAFYRSAAYWADWEFFDRLVSPASQKSGLVRGSHEWYGFASGELEALVQEAGLRIVDRIGCEGLAAQLPLEHLAQIEADPNRWPVWKEALLRTCNDPTIIGVSNHLLVVARKI
jgi:ubiquinone/menaquinone biosynthesis C-methylase UbiE